MYKKKIFLNIFCMILLILSVTSSISAKDDLNCSLCHNLKGTDIIDPDGKIKSFYVNRDLFDNLVHGKLTCETCHYTIIQTPHLPANLKRVDCESRCHVNDPFIDKNFTHSKEGSEFKISAHGDRVEKPLGCACHNKHSMGKVKEFSPLETNRICAYKCHENKLLMYKYKLDQNTIATYNDSFHGEAIKFDEKKYPSCLTCHGNHNVKIEEEKISPINKKNRLEKVCGVKDCHKTGWENQDFASGTYHQIYKKEEKEKELILSKIESGYGYLILITALLSAFYYIFRFISKARRKKISLSLLVLLVIGLVVSSPFILQSFIKEKGVRFAFNTSPNRYKSICQDCHSLLPHSKNVIMRSFMNLHSKKVSCEVCHVRSLSEIKLVDKDLERAAWVKRQRAQKKLVSADDDKPLKINPEERGVVYRWYNGGKDLANILRRLEGDDGSKIMLFKVNGNELEVLEATKDKGLDPNFRISPIAVQCRDCHDKKGLMDYRALGYPEKMVKERLERTRAFEMLNKSEKFLIPKLF